MSSAASASRTSSTHQRSPANARTSCPQPSGESQASQCGPASPIARRPNAPPSTAIASPFGATRGLGGLRGDRRDGGEHEPTAVNAAPSASAPVKASPVATTASITTSPSATSAIAATSSAAASGAWRPTTPAPTSSARPVSSSARVWRTTIRMLMRPASASAIPPSRQATSPPTESA